jgi:hypothetical protein
MLVRYESIAVYDELNAHQHDVNTFSSETKNDRPASSICRSASTKRTTVSTVDQLVSIANHAGPIGDQHVLIADQSLSNADQHGPGHVSRACRRRPAGACPAGRRRGGVVPGALPALPPVIAPRSA